MLSLSVAPRACWARLALLGGSGRAGASAGPALGRAAAGGLRRAHGHAHGHTHGHGRGPGCGRVADAAPDVAKEKAVPKLQAPGKGSAELQLRDDLAAAHRLMAAYGLDELIWNHLSARLPGWDDYLVTPGDQLWATVTPWNLVRGSANITANVLHSAVYQALPGEALAVAHCHSPAIEAVSCLEEGVMFLSQPSAAFYGRVAYHDWEGISDESAEAPRIVAALRSVERPPARALIMRNHGAITLGRTVGEAFVAMYYLNRICAVQLRVLSTGRPIRLPSKEALERAAGQCEQPGFSLGSEWDALRKWLGASEHGDLPPLLRSNLS